MPLANFSKRTLDLFFSELRLTKAFVYFLRAFLYLERQSSDRELYLSLLMFSNKLLVLILENQA